MSADVHVHMNYGGAYRNTPAHLVTQALAENLGIINSLIVNKEQRFPDIAYDGVQRDHAVAQMLQDLIQPAAPLRFPQRGACDFQRGFKGALNGRARV